MSSDRIQAIALGIIALILGVLALQSVWNMIADIRAARRTRKQKAARRLPVITVVMQLHSADPFIENIRSILASSYRTYSVILVANGLSRDDLRHLGALRKRYPKRIEAVVQRRSKQPLGTATLISRYASREALCLLDSTCAVQTDTLKHLARTLQTHPQIARLIPRVELRTSSWLTTTSQRYGSFLSRHSLSRRGGAAATPQSGLVPCVIRNSALRSKTTAQCNQAVVYQTGTAFSVPARPGVSSDVLSLLYCSLAILSLVVGEPVLFLAGWIIFTVSLAVLVVSDEQLSRAEKRGHFRHLMIAYVLFCYYCLAGAAGWMMRTIRSRLAWRISPAA